MSSPTVEPGPGSALGLDPTGADLPAGPVPARPPGQPTERVGGAGEWPRPRGLEALGRWMAALAGAFVIFAAVLISRGSDPVQVLSDAFRSTFTESASLQQILIKATPFALAALAVVVPARAGLVNVGGEGQVLVGAIPAAGVGLGCDQHVKRGA